jgi:plasmid stabilization system protein ParE
VKRYILSSEAKIDLSEITMYMVNEPGIQAARHVLREIKAAITFLNQNPGTGHIREYITDRPVKFWPRFSYLIVYTPKQPI